MIGTSRLLGTAAATLGLLAALAGDPRAAGMRTARQLAPAVAGGEGRLTALTLATWLRERRPGLRLVDLRTLAEFDERHLPAAEHGDLDRLPELAAQAARTDTLVLYDAGGDRRDGDPRAAQAWVLLRLLGRERVYYLAGGVAAWRSDVLAPLLSPTALPPAELARLEDLSRYFGGTPRRGDGPGAITSRDLGAPSAGRVDPAAARPTPVWRRGGC